MVIQDIQTGRISLPLRHPFKTALRTVDAVEDVVVRVIADTGETGYGEAPPTAVITGDTLGSIECAVRDFIRPALLGMEIENLDGIMKKLHGCILKNTSAKAAVDMAVYDLYGKRLGAPVYQLLGGARKRVETDLTISVNPIEEMVADALEAVGRGYRILKIKVGKEGRGDVERIAAIRSEAEADDLVDELIDRYGEPPRTVNNLISVALLRAAASQAGVTDIAQKKGQLVFTLDQFNLEQFSALCADPKFKDRLLLIPGDVPRFTLRLRSGDEPLRTAQALISAFSALG